MAGLLALSAPLLGRALVPSASSDAQSTAVTSVAILAAGAWCQIWAAALAAVLPASRLRRLDLRFTGITGRGAKLLVAALNDDMPLRYLGINHGVPRRLRRLAAAALGPAEPPHPDISAIASVYR